MPLNSEQSAGIAGDGELEQATRDPGLGELVEEVVAAARLLLLNIQIEPFDIAGVSVVVKSDRVSGRSSGEFEGRKWNAPAGLSRERQ